MRGGAPSYKELCRLMKRFRLTLAFVVASVIAIGAAFLIVNKAVDDLAERNVERIAEQDTFQDVMHVQAMIDDSLEETGMPVDRLAFPTLDEAAFFLVAITPGLVSGLGVERLDLLDLDGTILWSTDETMAGADKRDNPLFEKGAAGEIASRTVRGYELVDLAGFRRQTDVVEIYLPLRHQGSGQMIGVLTVFRDVGEELAAHLAASRDTLRWTTVTTMGGLFLILAGFVVAADVIIHRARRRPWSRARSARS